MAFEILGMLGKTLHIKNSFFRMLPNPTFYHWNTQFFDMPELLKAFKAEFNPGNLIQHPSERFKRLENCAAAVERFIGSDPNSSV